MKTFIFTFLCAFALSVSVFATDTTAKISDVHLCCKSCVKGVEKAVETVPGAKAEIDADGGTVTLSGPDSATVQKAASALVQAGYFGKTSDSIALDAATGAKNEKVKALNVEGVHLCCGKCVKSVDSALKSVEGVKAHTATKGAKTFEVTGDFNDQDVFKALQKEGLTGKVAK